jgi:hypothetical protein
MVKTFVTIDLYNEVGKVLRSAFGLEPNPLIHLFKELAMVVDGDSSVSARFHGIREIEPSCQDLEP